MNGPPAARSSTGNFVAEKLAEFSAIAEVSADARAQVDLYSFSLSIHSRIYEGQFSSFTPSASQRAKKCITSRSITLTAFRSKTMSASSGWDSNRLVNSAIAGVSIRPLRLNTVHPLRAAVSILKVIDQAIG